MDYGKELGSKGMGGDLPVGRGRLAKLRSSLLLVVLIAFLFLMLFLYASYHWKELIRFGRMFLEPARLDQFLESHKGYAVLIFVGLQIVQVLISPIPGEVTGVVGGFFFGTPMGMGLSMVGLTLGAVIAFVLARRFGLKLVEAALRKEHIERFNDFILRKGIHITFVLFLIPGFPKDTLCWLLGLSRLRLVDFLFINVLGRFPGTLLLTIQGSAVRNGKYREFFYLLAGSLALTGVLYLLRNHIVRWSSSMVHWLLGRHRNLLLRWPFTQRS